MRTPGRFLAVLTILTMGVAALSVPAGATREARPRSRSAAPPVVRGRDAGPASDRSTSLELFGDRVTGKGGVQGSPAGSVGRAPLLVSGFDALADPQAVPSDTTGALGQSVYVAAVNTQVAVYDRNGLELVAPIQLDDLHPDSQGAFSFDPKVIYDQYNDTFLVVYLVQEDAPRLSLIITVAIPDDTASDVGSWCATAFEGDAVAASPVLWADFPGLGYNATRVTISTNQFTFPSSTGTFRHAQIMSIDSGDLYSCNASQPSAFVFAGKQTRDTNGFQSFTLQPAQSVGASPGGQLLLSFEAIVGKRDYLTVWRIKPTASAFVLKKGLVRTGTIKDELPPLGTQGGGGINTGDTLWDAGDLRLIHAFYDADRDLLYGAHAVSKDLEPDTNTGTYPEAAVQWYEVDPARKLGNSARERRGTIGQPETDVGWPSMATDAEGNLFVTYSRASAPLGEFLGAWVAVIAPGSTSDTQLLLHAGAATYDATPGPERWGDYTAINRDPLSGGSLATFNQYASSSDQWQQFVSLVTDS